MNTPVYLHDRITAHDKSADWVDQTHFERVLACSSLLMLHGYITSETSAKIAAHAHEWAYPSVNTTGETK